eukprot:6669725-Prymnesium_polylepis.1
MPHRPCVLTVPLPANRRVPPKGIMRSPAHAEGRPRQLRQVRDLHPQAHAQGKLVQPRERPQP